MTDQTEPSGCSRRRPRAAAEPVRRTGAPAESPSATGIGRFAFHALVPSLLLPVVVVLRVRRVRGAGVDVRLHRRLRRRLLLHPGRVDGARMPGCCCGTRSPGACVRSTGLAWQFVILWALLVLLGVDKSTSRSLNLGSFVLGVRAGPWCCR